MHISQELLEQTLIALEPEDENRFANMGEEEALAVVARAIAERQFDRLAAQLTGAERRRLRGVARDRVVDKLAAQLLCC